MSSLFFDFSLANDNIRKYFEGLNDLAPTRELLYIHTHFIQNNFLSQIESIINEATEELSKSKKKAGVGIKIKSQAEKLAPLLNSINEESALEILTILRNIYQLCKLLVPNSVIFLTNSTSKE